MVCIELLLYNLASEIVLKYKSWTFKLCTCYYKKKENSMAFSPQTNYTDWATDTCWWNLVPTFADRGVSRGQRGGSPTVVNLSFLDRSRYFSFK
jgi:hypothetical protein